MNALFNNLEITDLFCDWQRRKNILDAALFQPHADLLLDQIVWPDIVSRKDQILAALKEKCQTANQTYDLTVPIWSFNVTFGNKMLRYFGGPPLAYALERGDKEALDAQWIHDNGWHHTLQSDDHSENSDLPTLHRTHLLPVVKKTDFLLQIASRFGSDFRVSVDQTQKSETTPQGNMIWVSTFTLLLHYYPKGLPEHHKKRMTEHKRSLGTRKRRVLLADEELVFWNGSRVTKSLPPPVPLLPPPPKLTRAPAVVDPYKTQCPYFGMYENCECHYHSGYDSDE